MEELKLEYKCPLVFEEWKPVKAITLEGAAQELATLADMYGVKCRNAETKEIVSLPYRRNAGRICDVTSGPCSCGAWH